MRLLISCLTIAFFSSLAVANVTADQEYILNHSGTAAQKAGLGTLLTKTRNLLVAKYSFAVQGGSTTADISLLTDLGNTKSLAKIPNKAVITNAWVETYTAPLSGGSATIAINSNSAGDILAATGKALFVANNYKQGIPTGATTTFIKLTAERTIKATIATSPTTAGKFNVFIEYVLGD